MIRILWVFFMYAIFSSCTSYYYVVRHAEKTSNDCNAPLASPAGFTRANVLKDTLLAKGIDSVFVSTCLRTQQTAQPLASAINRPMRQFDPTDPSTQILITRLKKIKGKEVLVVGHTSTVPAIVLGLSGRTISPIADTDFDNMYIVKRKTFLWTTKTLNHVTYGVPTN